VARCWLKLPDRPKALRFKAVAWPIGELFILGFFGKTVHCG